MTESGMNRRAFVRQGGALLAGAALGGLAVPAALASDPAEEERLKAVLWVGGHSHDFKAFASILAEALPKLAPLDIQVVKDGGFLDAPEADRLDVILMNHCFNTSAGVLTKTQRTKLLSTIRGGTGVVGLHASYYSFTKWDEMRTLWGARFVRHGKVDVLLEVRLVDREHPVTAGLPETFESHSELYQSTRLDKGCRLLAKAKEKGKDKEWPSVWTKTYGKGRVVTILPAHWPDAYRVAAFQRLIAQAARWAARPNKARRSG